MAFGAFEMDDYNNKRLFSGGYAEAGTPDTPNAFTTDDISESVKYSWHTMPAAT